MQVHVVCDCALRTELDFGDITPVVLLRTTFRRALGEQRGYAAEI
jgi:hypothetical protein